MVFAGSGSGKTALLRRLVEECALRGVSAIVLDPNNDLARLGDPWPAPPEGWRAGDADRARDYLAHTEVLVWTPRLAAGRPLSLQPLPDLVSLLDDRDEFGLASDTAVAALAPRARMEGNTAKAEQGRAVLREALAAFAREGGCGLGAFLNYLSDLPEGVAPSDGKTACTASTLALASQARKYGLGLVFATQAPKGIHNRIVGNAATQLYGFLNSAVQVAAAKEMAAARASTVLDIARLRAGEFYVGSEGREFRKVVTPMCLSHHPGSALGNEEVLSRARRRT